MKKLKTFYGFLALLAVVGALAWACSLDSPTAPLQNPPPPGGGTNPTSYTITITAEPDELTVNDPLITGQVCGGAFSNLKIRVRETGTGQAPANGTTVLLEVNIGSFEGADIPVQEFGVGTQNGDGFANFFACSTAGTAVVRAFLGTSSGRKNVEILPPVVPVVADFDFFNSDGDLEVQFQDLSTGFPTSWSWQFGDGDSSSQQHPAHEYPEFGDYIVTLTASNAVSSSSVSKVVTVAEAAPLPE